MYRSVMAQAMLPSWLVGISIFVWLSNNVPRCGRDMNLADRGSGPEGLAWRFPRKGCKKEVYALEHF